MSKLTTKQYKDWQRVRSGKARLDSTIADAIAQVAKEWALSRGATHYTHIFQPYTGLTAEKHDSFLSVEKTSSSDLRVLDVFVGAQLLKQEPDASSFPHGGTRTTFEARGYTVWDPSSPMYIRDDLPCRPVLYIPSVFISYNGEVLDDKTPLLRSVDAVNDAAMEVLRLIGNTSVSSVSPTLGLEQEFFLVNRDVYRKREDLRLTGRTLFGSSSPKDQQLENHYFGTLPSAAQRVMAETEQAMWQCGLPMKTRHSEVAPGQFEMAPIYEDLNVAVDHNMLLMSVLQKIAHRNGLKALLHEKPYAHVNGSGKHCNWSLRTDTGENLLEPGEEPQNNVQFLLFLVASLSAVQQHSGLIRASIATASNDHRLGGNEAPPSIMSVFLGDQLTRVLDAIEKSQPVDLPKKTQVTVSSWLDLNVSILPVVSRDATDRNRTSPFAFTGNKFEFRSVGSGQSTAFPMMAVCSALASSLNRIASLLKAKAGPNGIVSSEDAMTVVRKLVAETSPIRFEGNGYSADWVQEAKKRGLPILPQTPEALVEMTSKKSVAMLVDELSILTLPELQSRQKVLLEKYAKDIEIEGNVFVMMVRREVLPAVIRFRSLLAGVIQNLADPKASAPELSLLNTIGLPFAKLVQQVPVVEASVRSVSQAIKRHDIDSAVAEASKLRVLLEEARVSTDELEKHCPARDWPLPTYSELFTI